ncbi:MAG: hypothetical protein HQL13_07490, partial [Candidatus Omnitrophica bacterium]|nr:hypothetical protein [Candidatus Omnitrophota bacterium]
MAFRFRGQKDGEDVEVVWKKEGWEWKGKKVDFEEEWDHFIRSRLDLKGQTVDLLDEQQFEMRELAGNRHGRFESFRFPGELEAVRRQHKMGVDVTGIRCVGLTYNDAGNVVKCKFRGYKNQEVVESVWEPGLHGEWEGRRNRIFNAEAEWIKFIGPTSDENLFGKTIALGEDEQFDMDYFVDEQNGNFQFVLRFPGELKGKVRKHRMGFGVKGIRCVAKTFEAQGNIVAMSFQGRHPVKGLVEVTWFKKDNEWVAKTMDDKEAEVSQEINKVLDVFLDHLGGLCARYSLDIKNLLWGLVGAQLQGKYD